MIDFKLEFGFDKDGKIILADEFSPDTAVCGMQMATTWDKDVFRRGIRRTNGCLRDCLGKVAGIEITTSRSFGDARAEIKE